MQVFIFDEIFYHMKKMMKIVTMNIMTVCSHGSDFCFATSYEKKLLSHLKKGYVPIFSEIIRHLLGERTAGEKIISF